MRRFRQTLLACATAAAFGCGHLTTVQAQGSGAVVAASLPTLTGVLSQILDADPQVRSARAVYDIAQARMRQAQSRYWPTAGLTAALGESTDREFNVEVQRRTERVEGVLRWNLYNGGIDRNEIAATEREIASARADFDRARSDVSERIADAWIEAQRAKAVAAVSRQRLHDVARLTNQIVTQGAAGRLSDTDVLQAQVALSETQVSHESIIAEAESSRARLETMIGRPLDGVAPVGFPALSVDDSVVHPALRAARERADAAAARQRRLAEALAPRLDLEVRQRLIDRTDPAPTTALRRGATVSMTWDMPLGGEPFARQDEAQRRVEAARAEADRIDLLLRAELAALRLRERGSVEAVERGRAQVEQSRALLRAANVQFESGRRTLPQVIQARDVQFAAEQRYAEAQARLHQLRMRQWSMAGGLLAAVGLDTPATNVAVQASPAMQVPTTVPSPAAPLPALSSAPAAVAAPAAAPSVQARPATSDIGTANEESNVLAQMAAWRAAWAARQVDAYLAFYAPGFAPAMGLTRAQWEAQRRRVVGGQRGAIQIDLVAPKIERRGETFVVEFEQRYRSDSFRDTVRKRLTWAREGSAWRIVGESAE